MNHLSTTHLGLTLTNSRWDKGFLIVRRSGLHHQRSFFVGRKNHGAFCLCMWMQSLFLNSWILEDVEISTGTD